MSWFRWHRPITSTIMPIVAVADGAAAIIHSAEGGVRAVAYLGLPAVPTDPDEQERFLIGLSDVFRASTGPLQLVVSPAGRCLVVAAPDPILLLDRSAAVTERLLMIGAELKWLSADDLSALSAQLIGRPVSLTDLGQLAEERVVKLNQRPVACATIAEWPDTLGWGDLDWLWDMPDVVVSLRVIPMPDPVHAVHELRDQAYLDLDQTAQTEGMDIDRRLRAHERLELAQALDAGLTTLHRVSLTIVAPALTAEAARQRVRILIALGVERGFVVRDCPRTADTLLGTLPFGIAYRGLDERAARQLGAVTSADARSLPLLCPLVSADY